MSRSNKFPDIGEFRSQLRAVGFSTGADDRVALPPAGSSKSKPIGRGTTALWATMGSAAVGILVWLAADIGGGRPMMAALYESGRGGASGWSEIRLDARRIAAQLSAQDTPTGPFAEGEQVKTLKRRVAMLEDMLTGQDTASGSLAAATPHTPSGAPEFTASIPYRTTQFAGKIDLPRKSEDRAPTAPRASTTARLQPGPLSVPEVAHRSRLAPQVVFGLDLGAYDSVTVMKQRWNLIEGHHNDVLGGLIPRRVTEYAADGRVAHRLIAGPIDDAMDVANRCAALLARSVPCRQTLGAGEPL